MDGWIAIVMAGGLGTRMRSKLPKVLHPVAGLPLVTHTMRAVQALGLGEVVLVVRPDAREAISAAAGERVRCVDQPGAGGTGEALALALAAVPESTANVLLLNAEKPLLLAETIEAFAAHHARQASSASVLTLTLPAVDAEHLGSVERGADGAPTAIVEASERAGADAPSLETNVGVYAFETGWVREAVRRLQPHASGELFVTDLLAMAAADGKTTAAEEIRDPDEGLSVKTRADLATVESVMQQRLRAVLMEGGATLVDPATTYVDATARVGSDVVIEPNTALRGATKIGDGAHLGPNAQITDSEIGPDAVVGPAVLEGAVVERGAHVGAFSHLRAGAVLEEGAFVGSHAEIKASRIGRGAHVGHFSYVGDADVGDGANIGAGTVTCNYDGTAKHRTIIGAGAFIGSDSLLVAPVRVGANAVTGAGAVVNRDVADGERVAGVPARSLRSQRSGAAVAAPEEGGRTLG